VATRNDEQAERATRKPRVRAKTSKLLAAGGERPPQEPKRAFNTPKKTTGGNSPIDQEWLETVMEAGEIIEVVKETIPDHIVFEPMYMWDATQDELNPDFWMERRRYQHRDTCTATSYVRDQRGGYIVDRDWNRLRKPCISLPMKGGYVCHAHGGEIAMVKQQAADRLAHAADTVAARLVTLTGVRDEEQRYIRPQDRIMASNSVLDRAGVKGSSEVEIKLPGYKKVLDAMFGGDDGDETDA
jgi:hypothetical protein